LSNIIVSVITSTVVTLIINTIIKGGIGFYFSSRLEKFKTDLVIITEEKKLDFQKKIHGFSLYSNKRHEVYPMLYKNFIEANDALSHSYRMSRIQQDFFNDKKTDLPEEVSSLVKSALEKSEKAFDYAMANDLFLSPNVSDHSLQLAKKIVTIASEINMVVFSETHEINGEDYGLKSKDINIDEELKNSNALLYKLRVLLKKELGGEDE
jgi:hypothetical protein